MMIKQIIFIMGFFMMQGASAKAVHQCNINGSIVFQTLPCSNEKRSGDHQAEMLKKEQEKLKAQEQAEAEYRMRLEQSAANKRDLLNAVKNNNRPMSLKPISRYMSFSECQKVSNAAKADAIQYQSKVMVDSSTMYMVRICNAEGSVLMTCSAGDKKLTTTKTSNCPL